jgi:hypothetical protein
MDEWNTESLTTFERWSEILEFVRSECISLKNTQLVLEFSFAIPSISATTQRVFSTTHAMWTDENSRFPAETIKAVIVTKTHFQEFSCNDFYTLISNNPKLLQEICSSTKYKTSAQEERMPPSTLAGN